MTFTHSVKKAYEGLIYVGECLQSPFLLAVRLFWGSSLLLTGFAKLINIQPVAEFFSSINIPFPTFNAYAAGSVECIGGALLLIGLCSRLAAIPVMFVMLVAYFTAHYEAVQNLWANPTAFITELPFTYLLAAIIIFIFGPGKVSIDYLLEKYVFKHP